jgi:hypothetical protein
MEVEVEFPADIGLSNSSSGIEMVSPTLSPFASEAPRLAASMMPGPPPVQTTKRRSLRSSFFDQAVKRWASSRAAS